MRDALWPGSPDDHDHETRAYFDGQLGSLIVLIAEVDSGLVGFLELDFRKDAPGCGSSPVPFIEGWYVEPDARGRGLGRALMEAAEDLARASGFKEIASDANVTNTVGIRAHVALGYDEVERQVSFRKDLYLRPSGSRRGPAPS